MGNLTMISDTDWEAAQAQLGGHLLQSAPWAEFQATQGRRLAGRGVVGEASVQAFIYREAGWKFLYAPYGPTIGISSEKSMLKKAFWHGMSADFVRLEPLGGVSEEELKAIGAVPSVELNPAHTSIVDLTLSEEELRANLNSGHRNAINGAERRGLSFEEGSAKDLPDLMKFLKQTAGRGRFRPHSEDYYRKMVEVLGVAGVAKVYVAKHEKQAVAIAITFDYQGTRMYAHAAADKEGRKLQAAVPLVWHMVLEAKKVGLKQFDLWGVAPEGAPASHAWAGFSQFKRAFGGADVTRVGTWDLPLHLVRYRLYRAARMANRLVRR